MTRDEFTRLADTWGGDVARWPDRHHDAAAAFIRQHPDAAAELARAGDLDRLLALSTPEVSEERAMAAARAVVTHLAADPPEPVRFSRLRRWLAPAMGFACAASLGIYLGFVYPVMSGPNDSIAGRALVMILNDDAMLTWIQ
jgi:anti-sigma factor RsiW